MNGIERESWRGDSMEQAYKEFQEKIEFISMIVINRRAVPFLGAGVSLSAVHEDANNSTRHLHITDCMCKRVCRHIVKHWNLTDRRSLPRSLKKRIYKATKGSRENGLGLAEACEVALSSESSYQSDSKSEDLVKNVLRIPEFSGLSPTRAHRYIAFLAREGLIEEVFTTNYDCCMERAYRQSFTNEPEKAVNQIHNGRTYRQQVGRSPDFDWKNREYPRLTVYKLNGCAHAITKDAKYDTILLTERQLQDWRERQWARDIFRDRLRSRSIIFSGFGSPEPQIRHTVVQVLEEMSSGTSENASGGEAHPPYVVCYSPKEEPTFHQWQIANAFCQSDGNTKGLSVNDLLIIHPDNQCLSADRFWEMIYNRVAFYLLQELLAPHSEVADRMQILLGGNGRVLGEIIALLERCLKETAISHSNTNILRWSNEHETTLLARWLYLIEGAGSHPIEQQGIYIAIRDHRILVGDLLLLWGAYIEKEETVCFSESNVFEEEPEIGVRIRLDEQGQILYLAGAGRCEEHPFWPDGGNAAQKVALLILGPMRPGIKPALVRPRRESNAKERRFEDIILVRLYLSEILRSREHPPQSLGELREFLERIALTPTVFFRKEQRSLHNRLKSISSSGGRP